MQFRLHCYQTPDPVSPGCHVVRAHTMDHHGGVWLPRAVVADTLAGLVAMMPPGLVRDGKAPFDPAEVMEVWDQPRTVHKCTTG